MPPKNNERGESFERKMENIFQSFDKVKRDLECVLIGNSSQVNGLCNINIKNIDVCLLHLK